METDFSKLKIGDIIFCKYYGSVEGRFYLMKVTAKNEAHHLNDRSCKISNLGKLNFGEDCYILAPKAIQILHGV